MNNTPTNTNVIHNCHLTATNLATNLNNTTFPSHATRNSQSSTINTNMNSTSYTDNEPNNSHPTAMDTMDTSLYSPNPLSTPTPDCEAVLETVG